MIVFEEALSHVLHHTTDFGEESIPFEKANGRVLAEVVFADRDFPPFNRATKDGIAIKFERFRNSVSTFKIEAIAAAGSPQLSLTDDCCCIEIMTGAIVPHNTDTVVMYEHLNIENGVATIGKQVREGQNIHLQGSDEKKGAKLLQKGIKISAAEIGVLATVGKSKVLVKRNPKVCLVSTGDELVNVDEVPQPHQIRKSNSHTLSSALRERGIQAEIKHIADSKEETKKEIEKIIEEFNVVLLSGGVSKGKYDYLPEAFKAIGVTKKFHRVKQRPGKPFWFGVHEKAEATIFAFPGNPASTFANFHVYFIPWLNKCLGLKTAKIRVVLKEVFENTTDLTRFISAKIEFGHGILSAYLVQGNGSGDLTSLAKSDGFIKIEPNTRYKIGQEVMFYPTRSIL